MNVESVSINNDFIIILSLIIISLACIIIIIILIFIIIIILHARPLSSLSMVGLLGACDYY